jgi:Peptidase A4 family
MRGSRLWVLAGALTLAAAAGVGVVTHLPAQATRLSSDSTGVTGVTGIPGSSPAGLTRGAEGWGKGGYMMMPGPGGASASGGAPADGAASGTATTSMNWSGYAATGGRFTSVSSSWTQPAVTCTAQDTFSSFWVGLDGDGTASVEQTGTEADCSGGAATYSGWFEMFPAAPVFYNNPVRPGDAMSASVTTSGSGSFTLTLTDQTQGWNQVTTQTSATAQLGSAEVIAEAPSGATVEPLSNFGTVSFSNATVDGAPIGGSASLSALTMVSAASVTEATPSALTGGNAFSVTWNSSGG